MSMVRYEWKRGDERVLTESPTSPPGEGWIRVYSFGLGSVKGVGGSPGRTSLNYHRKET